MNPLGLQFSAVIHIGGNHRLSNDEVNFMSSSSDRIPSILPRYAAHIITTSDMALNDEKSICTSSIEEACFNYTLCRLSSIVATANNKLSSLEPTSIHFENVITLTYEPQRKYRAISVCGWSEPQDNRKKQTVTVSTATKEERSTMVSSISKTVDHKASNDGLFQITSSYGGNTAPSVYVDDQSPIRLIMFPKVSVEDDPSNLWQPLMYSFDSLCDLLITLKEEFCLINNGVTLDNNNNVPHVVPSWVSELLETFSSAFDLSSIDALGKSPKTLTQHPIEDNTSTNSNRAILVFIPYHLAHRTLCRPLPAMDIGTLDKRHFSPFSACVGTLNGVVDDISYLTSLLPKYGS